MLLAKVLGNVVATQKNVRYENASVMLCQQITPQGEETGSTILALNAVDAGVGDKENAKFSEIYGLDRVRHLEHSLAEAGMSAEDVDIVLATHLHFDHAGGFTVRDG